MGTGFSRRKKEARLMQERFQKIQTQLTHLEVSGEAANGLVTITLTGDGDMKSIKIKPECVDKEDIEGLEFLIKTAYNEAQQKLKDQSPSL